MADGAWGSLDPPALVVRIRHANPHRPPPRICRWPHREVVAMPDRTPDIPRLRQLLGAATLETVSLADRVHVMLGDDEGVLKSLPVNPAATRLYQEARGIPYQIRGDVVIVPDSDYAREA
ncbi:hypothetical protein G6F22_020750 [Rhizopus arrhizus]|nr:hypothetical protein G6F22_020750 [Rhizopus arrhizus]